MLSENTRKVFDKYLEHFEQNFVNQFEEDMKWRVDRRTNTFSNFHSSKAINALNLDEFKKVISELWAFQFWTNKDWYFENTMKINANTFPSVKENIVKLCFSDASIEKRVNTFLERTNGMSLAFISEILYLSSNSQFPIYNGTTKKLLKQLGINLRDRLPRGDKRNQGMIYKEFVSVYAEILKYIKSKNKTIDTFEKLDTFIWKTDYSDDSVVIPSVAHKQDDLTEDFSILVVKMGRTQKRFDKIKTQWEAQKVASFGFHDLEGYDPKKHDEYNYEYLKTIMQNNNSPEGRIKKLASYVQAFHKVRPGKDWVIAYFKSHLHGFGRVTSKYHINKNLDSGSHTISVDWVWLDKPIRLPDYSRPLYRQAKHNASVNIVNNSTAIRDFFKIVEEYGSEDKVEEIEADIQGQIGSYTIDEVAQEAFISEERLNDIENSLHNKKQVIFDGVPGTGKTFVAQRLGEYLSKKEGKPIGDYKVISCHGGMSFEYLFQGLAPKEGGTLQPEKGIIAEFAEKAAENEDAFYVLILDEINRTNIPQVFGQMLYLLEYRGDRGEPVDLPYAKETIIFPENLLIIATMNSEDRSAGVLDFAFRRRFSYFHFEPDHKVLKSWLEKYHKHFEEVDIPRIVKSFKSLNKTLNDHDENFQIGHSYFMTKYPLSEAGIKKLWETEIDPLLKERFFYEKSKKDDFKLEKFFIETEPEKKMAS